MGRGGGIEETVHASRSSSGVFVNKPGSSHWIDEDVSGSNPIPVNDDEIQPSKKHKKLSLAFVMQVIALFVRTQFSISYK